MSNNLDPEFYNKLMQTIEVANKKQTEEIKLQIDSVKQTIKEEVDKRNQLELKYEELKNKYENLEKSLRKNNIIIFGLQKDKEENLANFVVEVLNKNLQLKLTTDDINDTFTIGKKEDNKPIIVKFVSYLKKQEVIKNCYKLKDSNKNNITKIYIAEELSIEERKIKKILTQHLKAAKAQKLYAYIKGNKLYVNNEVYTAQQLTANEEEPYQEEQEEEEEDIQQNKRERNSAPATPNIRNKKRETGDSDTDSENCSKKIKTNNKPLGLPRSSSRILEKNQKPGKPRY